ncbi:hypothetical protein CC86DRAFT_77506 [Ophiobolus disseminans]|uniref:Uncharacterized protein n=1 Tax=Ophiobolus disseminans TaxID=1469910 RepID=A0A6A6ZPU8_9PLEO|nr:hypothetical protein CC86DRAFT_77506 [Ophiobolus disseminans]
MSIAAILVEKPSPKNSTLPNAPVAATLSKKAWRKVVETLRPGERKRRRAKELDEMMRREINNPIGDMEASSVKSEGDVQDYHTMARRQFVGPAEDAQAENWSSALEEMSSVEKMPSQASGDGSSCETAQTAKNNACDSMSLWSALEYTEPAEGEAEDEITALPSFPSDLRQQTLVKKERKRLRKSKSTMM